MRIVVAVDDLSYWFDHRGLLYAQCAVGGTANPLSFSLSTSDDDDAKFMINITGRIFTEWSYHNCKE